MISRTRRFLGIILVILLGSAFVSLIAQTYYMNNYPAMDEYFGGKSEHGPILRALTFVILYNVLIPLSLYVSLDLIRTALARSIEADPRINWDGLPGGCPAQALTANLVSDLGQVCASAFPNPDSFRTFQIMFEFQNLECIDGEISLSCR